MRGLINYLSKYYKIQKDILVVSHPTRRSTWADRCMYLDDSFDVKKHYNHRSILLNEVVIEYDEDDVALNKRLADKVCVKLKQDGIGFSKWFSGNKSYHVHFFINVHGCRNVCLLKKVLVRKYGTFFINEKGFIHCSYSIDRRKILPDLRLCSNNHLVRAEYGIHEKTKKYKSLMYQSKDYPKINNLSNYIWEEYTKQATTVMRRRVSHDVNQIQSLRGFKYIITSQDFRLSDDGRERALFMLIHLLKGNYENRMDEFVKYLQDWYRYSSGRKLSDMDIERKVRYHWNRNYTITERYLNELLESIGREDLIGK